MDDFLDYLQRSIKGGFAIGGMVVLALVLGWGLRQGLMVMDSYVLADDTSNSDILDYAHTTKADVLAVIPNTVTPSEMDFFVTTSDNQTFLIAVSETADTFSHTETEVTKATPELQAMQKASIESLSSSK